MIQVIVHLEVQTWQTSPPRHVRYTGHSRIWPVPRHTIEKMALRKPAPTLIALSGLPGVGKTTLAQRLSSEMGAVHLRIDAIEAALTASGMVDLAGGWSAVPDAGYRVAYARALDHLTAGHSVVADSVNPLAVTREAWARCAQAGGVRLLNVASGDSRSRTRVDASPASGTTTTRESC